MDEIGLKSNEFDPNSVYLTPNREKAEWFLTQMEYLVSLHKDNSNEYRKICESLFAKREGFSRLDEVPFIPVQLFKELTMSSIEESQVYREILSSGTTDSRQSKIIIDRETANLQSQALINIVAQDLGKQRVPMLAIDSKHVIHAKYSYSARAAAILGFAKFSSNLYFALDENLEVDHLLTDVFFERYCRQPVIIFGFTYLIWRFLEELRVRGLRYELENSVLIHGGGWKKLESARVSKQEFSLVSKELLGVDRVIDYYGMAEQVGSIFMECPSGFFHTSLYSEIIIRDSLTLEMLPFGQTGLIQLLSTVPKSYPGHSILSQDLGVIHGDDDCRCGRKGKYFEVVGRAKLAEIRGCSDTIGHNEV